MYFQTACDSKAEHGAELGSILRLCLGSCNLTFLIVGKGGHPGS